MTYTETEGRWTTPNGRPIVFRYRQDTNDWNSVSSCTTGDEYGLRGMTIDGPVLDVGGHLGSVGITIAVDHKDAHVTIIEPIPANAALIRHNAERNGVADRVTVIEGAVGKAGQSVSVAYGFRGNETAQHHAFIGNSTFADGDHESVTYPAKSLAQMVKALGPIDLLKIDCEGGEWGFLHGPALRKVRRIIGEAHSVQGHTGADIVGMLPDHDVTLSGDPAGTCGFAAVLR